MALLLAVSVLGLKLAPSGLFKGIGINASLLAFSLGAMWVRARGRDRKTDIARRLDDAEPGPVCSRLP